jgi:hypothetical protein
VAFDRLLARIFTKTPSFFFLKGGYAMELRIARARATKDMDLTWFKRQSNATLPMSELILYELQMLARVNLNDHFIYQIGQPQRDVENAPYGGSQHSVSAIIDSRPFIEFHLDVGGDFLIDDVEKVSGVNWLEFCDIPAPIIPMISAANVEWLMGSEEEGFEPSSPLLVNLFSSPMPCRHPQH